MNCYLTLLNELANFFLIIHILPVIFAAKKKKKKIVILNYFWIINNQLPHFLINTFLKKNIFIQDKNSTLT